MVRTLAVAAFLVGCTGRPAAPYPPGDPRDVDPQQPDPFAAVVSEELVGLADVSRYAETLERVLTQPTTANAVAPVTLETCDEVRRRVGVACGRIMSSDPAASCSESASFFYAHDVPRCAVRVKHSLSPNKNLLTPLFAFDLTGAPVGAPPDGCGNGILEQGEDCDDGNRDAWDNCDPHCKREPFNGCETVIQSFFASSGVAEVDANSWRAPRSHLMVNEGRAMRAMDASQCKVALSVANDVCNELGQTMPFVSFCTPSAELWNSPTGVACSLRLDVSFRSLDASFGVFTTSLGGVLAFTIQ